MHPGNLLPSSCSNTSGAIQLPSFPETPSATMGIVSRLLGVEMKVLLSTLATSLGSVLASQLKNGAIIRLNADYYERGK